MTMSIFTTWLNRLNNRMRFEQRHILMFVDNCAAHPDVQLSHVKLVFLLPNTTSASAVRCRHHPNSEDALQEASPSSRPAPDGCQRDRHSIYTCQVGYRVGYYHMAKVGLGHPASQHHREVLQEMQLSC